MVLTPRALLVSALLTGGCTPARAVPADPLYLPASDGGKYRLIDGAAPATMIEFFSAHCPVQTSHDQRLKELALQASRSGIAFRVVDSEAFASPERDRAQAEQRAYAFPILSDPQGLAADIFDARAATLTLIVARQGSVLYRGGIDSDRLKVADHATPFVAEALEQVAAGRAVQRPTAPTLGCSLERR